MRFRLFIGVPILIGLSACATIPQESVDLSIELGKRISAIEASHLTLLRAYFDEKRERVDKYVVEKWVPEFAEQVFSNRQIAAVWDEVVNSGDKEKRLEFIVGLGPKLQTAINKKRLELVKPLDGAEQMIERELKINYEQARSINNSVTSFLVSSAKISENRNRYLEMLAVKDEKVSEILVKVDSTVESLVENSEKLMSKEDKVKEYLKRFQDLKDKF